MESEITVNIVRLDSEVIEEHLRTSTVFLHDILSQDEDNSVSEENSDQHLTSAKNVTCTHCGKIYNKQNTLQRHILLKHNAQCRKCLLCEKTYPSQLSLEQHVRYMHSKHRCVVCYRSFENAKSLLKHGEGCKKAEMACKDCGKMYMSAVSLRNHVKYMHPAKSGPWCALCRREFVSEAKLVNHRNTIHPAGATDCSCGRSFTSVTALKSHMLYKHTQDIAKCRHCHKAFATAARLARHMERLHGDNGLGLGIKP